MELIKQAIRELRITASVYERLAAMQDREDAKTHAHLCAAIGDASLPPRPSRMADLLDRAKECRRIANALQWREHEQ